MMWWELGENEWDLSTDKVWIQKDLLGKTCDKAGSGLSITAMPFCSTAHWRQLDVLV